MKNKLKIVLLTAFVLTAATFTVSAQVYVTIRPTFPVMVKPPQPSPVYIWVNEEWEPNGNAYRYTGGHWEAPAQPGYYRRPGYWQRSKNGNRWIKGTWAKSANSTKGNNGVGYGSGKGNGNKKHRKH
ncbi:MAG TPA: hypothetical protein VHL77_02970 [Ferruginibacter sp.]|nr:hypothetical protein [Ferruginibacter sp.]